MGEILLLVMYNINIFFTFPEIKWGLHTNFDIDQVFTSHWKLRQNLKGSAWL